MSTPVSSFVVQTSVTLTPGSAVKTPGTNTSNRLFMIFLNQTTGPVYYGYISGVNASNGFPVGPGEQSRMIITTAQVWVYSDNAGTIEVAEYA